MGNCMERYKEDEDKGVIGVGKGEEEEKREGVINASGLGGGRGRMKLKIVLTREELEMFLDQLNVKNGEEIRKVKVMENALVELERLRAQGDRSESRHQHGGWKPSLESIVEGPEMVETDDESSP